MPAPPLFNPIPKGPASGRAGVPGFDSPQRVAGTNDGWGRGCVSSVVTNECDKSSGRCWPGSSGPVRAQLRPPAEYKLASLPVLALPCPSWGPADRQGAVLGATAWVGPRNERGGSVTTEELDFAGIVGCPHCCGIMTGPWKSHSSTCPNSGAQHECEKCDRAEEDFAEWVSNWGRRI